MKVGHRELEGGVRLVNIGLVGVIVYVAVGTIVSLYETKRFAPLEGNAEEAHLVDLAAIGAGLRLVTAPIDIGDAPAAPVLSDSLTLTALLIDPTDDTRSRAVFEDKEGSVGVLIGETIRPGLRLIGMATDGVTVETADGERSIPLKKSLPPAAAYIAEATPTPTPVPTPPPGVTVDDPDGEIVRRLWPVDEEA